MKRNSELPRNVKLLSWVSLFTDAASDMLYPILPILWQQRGISFAAIGMIEGIASFVTGVSKGYWGALSDSLRRYKPLVWIGYSLSALAKPLLFIGSSFVWPLVLRNVERLGKAIRTAPRDAILAAETKPETQARVFSYHRSMDTLGSVIGPLLCLLVLWLTNGSLSAVFIASIVPGLAAMYLASRIREPKKLTSAKLRVAKPKTGGIDKELVTRVWRLPAFRHMLLILGLFSLINSSDAFLLLRLNELGLSLQKVVAVYCVYNLINAVVTRNSRWLLDRFGVRITMLFCMTVFCCVYSLLSLDFSSWVAVGAVMLYGLFDGTFEVTVKTWLVRIVPTEVYATATGLYGMFAVTGFMISSIGTGLLLSHIGNTTYLLIGVLTVVPITLLAWGNNSDFAS